MTKRIAFIQNQNIFDVIGLTDDTDSSLIEDAVISLTVKEKDGDDFTAPAITWPVTLGNLTGGNYRYTAADDWPFIAGRGYVAEFAASSPTKGDAFFSMKFTAKVKTL